MFKCCLAIKFRMSEVVRHCFKQMCIATLVSGILVANSWLINKEFRVMADVPLNNIRPLVPRLLLKEESGCEEINGEISNRFDLPAARLVNLPANFIESVCSQLLVFPEDKLEHRLEYYLEEDKISYTAISSLRYNTAKGEHIYLTTLLLSRKASMLNYRGFESMVASDGSQPSKKITLKGNTQAMLFANPTMKNARNQIVFLQRYQDYVYYITVGSDLPADELINLASNHLDIQPTKRP